jgi:hypothetical protein
LLALIVTLAIGFTVTLVGVQLRYRWSRWAAIACVTCIFLTYPTLFFVERYIFGHSESQIPEPSPITLGGVILLFVPFIASTEVRNYFAHRPA